MQRSRDNRRFSVSRIVNSNLDDNAFTVTVAFVADVFLLTSLEVQPIHRLTLFLWRQTWGGLQQMTSRFLAVLVSLQSLQLMLRLTPVKKMNGHRFSWTKVKRRHCRTFEARWMLFSRFRQLRWRSVSDWVTLLAWFADGAANQDIWAIVELLAGGWLWSPQQSWLAFGILQAR